MKIIEFFEDVDTEREYNGYYYSVGEALTIVILGTFCGLKNIRQIHQWSDNERIRNFLKENSLLLLAYLPHKNNKPVIV